MGWPRGRRPGACLVRGRPRDGGGRARPCLGGCRGAGRPKYSRGGGAGLAEWRRRARRDEVTRLEIWSPGAHWGPRSRGPSGLAHGGLQRAWAPSFGDLAPLPAQRGGERRHHGRHFGLGLLGGRRLRQGRVPGLDRGRGREAGRLLRGGAGRCLSAARPPHWESPRAGQHQAAPPPRAARPPPPRPHLATAASSSAKSGPPARMRLAISGLTCSSAS
jgi:hypothetical protein